jgi:hypothetical protein
VHPTQFNFTQSSRRSGLQTFYPTITIDSTFAADTTVSLDQSLDFHLEVSWGKDAAVQQRADRTYLMAYVSEIP